MILEAKEKVSILLATYNRAHLIEETLSSLRNQSYSNFECFITDDNSIDNTEKLVLDYIQNDSRFQYFKKPTKYPKGLSATRNFGLDLVQKRSFEYILLVDDDDILHPLHLETCVNALEVSGLDFVHYRIQPFTEGPIDFKPVMAEDSFDLITEKNLIEVLDNKIALASCSVMWRKNAIQNERFQEELFYAEELEFYSRLLIMGKIGCKIPATLYYNRKHSNSNTGKFFMGNPKYTQSLIRAYYMCADNLILANKMNYSRAKYFIWRAVLNKNEALYHYILDKAQLKSLSRLKLKLIYNLSGLIGFYLKQKKHWLGF